MALALLAGCGSAVADSTYLGRYIWADDTPGFGGISAIDVTADGSGFTVISDRATATRGRFQRENGVITGVVTDENMVLRRKSGEPMRGANKDSEGIAIGPDGHVYISFEWNARVLDYPTLDGQPTLLPQHPDFPDMQMNSSLEGLAIDDAGRLYTLPERSGRADRPFPVYRYDQGTWDIAFRLPRRGPFLPVGLDIGPDGRLYLLERDFTGIGFRSRIRRFDLTGGAEETLLQTRTGSFDNLEGISVWRDAAGLRATLVSDDNFRFYQRTEFVEFRLTE